MFTTGLVGGISKVGIRGDMVIDGALTARMISVVNIAAISADLGAITAGSLTSPNGKYVNDLTNCRELWYD